MSMGFFVSHIWGPPGGRLGVPLAVQGIVMLMVTVTGVAMVGILHPSTQG